MPFQTSQTLIEACKLLLGLGAEPQLLFRCISTDLHLILEVRFEFPFTDARTPHRLSRVLALHRNPTEDALICLCVLLVVFESQRESNAFEALSWSCYGNGRNRKARRNNQVNNSLSNFFLRLYFLPLILSNSSVKVLPSLPACNSSNHRFSSL